MVPDVAEIVVEPAATACASPEPPIVATEVADEAQATEFVMTAVLPSVYVPVATNCFVLPGERETLEGVTAIDLRTAGVT
jgi:hypothetical protein